MELSDDMLTLQVDEIEPNPDQPRKFFDMEKIKVMAESINEIGLDSPMQLIWKDNGDGGIKATIKDGERRWRAIKYHTKIKELHYGKDFIYVDVPKEDLKVRTLIACCMREGLKPIEKAMALMELLEKRGFSKKEIAISTINRAKDWVDNDYVAEPSSKNYFVPVEKVKQIAGDMKKIGISGTNAVKLLKLLDLPKDIQEQVVFSTPNTRIYREVVKRNRLGNEMKPDGIPKHVEVIPLTFAYELARLNDRKIIKFFLDKAFSRHWTSRKLNLMVTDFLSSGLTSQDYMDSYRERCRCKSYSRNELDKLSTQMDNFSSTITSFRTINFVAMAEEFQRKMFMVSGCGLRRSCIKLQNALNNILFNAKKLSKIKEDERHEVLKLPFRVKLASTAKNRRPAFRFSIPVDIGRKIEESLDSCLGEGYEVELQINAVFKPSGEIIDGSI